MSNVHELQTLGRVYVQYPPNLRYAIADTMDLWEKFCALPEDVKLTFPYEKDEQGSGNGYELKKEEGCNLDQKENFHLRLAVWSELLKHARSIDNGDINNFVLWALTLPKLIMSVLTEFARDVEQTFHIPGFETAVSRSLPQLYIRFLHYFGDCEPEDELASPHIDKGGFTLHLYESDCGVEFLNPDRLWESLPVSHDETVIFPALGMQYRLRNEVKALCHRVIATPETAAHGRYSAVCFAYFASNAYYDKERHGRLQDFPPGFNYDLSYGEL